jgi:hypothetical protein
MEKIDPQRKVGAPNGIYTDVGADFNGARKGLRIKSRLGGSCSVREGPAAAPTNP